MPFRLLGVFRVERVKLFIVVYEDLVAHEIRCESCGTVYLTDAARYSHFEQGDSDYSATLAQKTHPFLEKRYAERASLEERLRTRKLTADERAQLLVEPFLAVRDVLTRRASRPNLDRATCWTGAAAAALAIILEAVARWSSPTLGQYLHVLAILCGIAGAFLVLLLVATDTRRFSRRCIVPRLVKSLHPLDPTPYELDRILGYFASRGERIGRMVSSADLQVSLTYPVYRPTVVQVDRPSLEDIRLMCIAVAELSADMASV